MAFSNDEKQEIKDIVLETMTEQSDAVDYTEQVVEFAPGDEVPIVRNGDGTGEKSYGRAPVSMFGGGGSSGINGIKVGGSGQVLTPTSGVVTLPAYETGAEKNPTKYLKEATISQDGNSLMIKDNNNETKTFTPIGGGSAGTVTGIKVGESGTTINPDGNGVVQIPSYEAGAEKHKAPTSQEVKNALGTGSGTTKYLREDGEWATPPSGGGGGNTADVNYDTNNKKITKTIDGVTSDVVTVATLKTDMNLGNVGNFKAVSTVANQGLSNTEKSNARTNIGAGTSNFSGNYNDLTNKPTIPCADKSYAPLAHSGLGRKTLQLKDGGNILTQEDFSDANTIYVIQYDFDLDGEDINVPNNCIIEFDGGSVNNGTFRFNGATVKGEPKGTALYGVAYKDGEPLLHNYKVRNKMSQVTDFAFFLSLDNISRGSTKPYSVPEDMYGNLLWARMSSQSMCVTSDYVIIFGTNESTNDGRIAMFDRDFNFVGQANATGLGHAGGATVVGDYCYVTALGYSKVAKVSVAAIRTACDSGRADILAHKSTIEAGNALKEDYIKEVSGITYVSFNDDYSSIGYDKDREEFALLRYEFVSGEREYFQHAFLEIWDKNLTTKKRSFNVDINKYIKEHYYGEFANHDPYYDGVVADIIYKNGVIYLSWAVFLGWSAEAAGTNYIIEIDANTGTPVSLMGRTTNNSNISEIEGICQDPDDDDVIWVAISEGFYLTPFSQRPQTCYITRLSFAKELSSLSILYYDGQTSLYDRTATRFVYVDNNFDPHADGSTPTTDVKQKNGVIDANGYTSYFSTGNYCAPYKTLETAVLMTYNAQNVAYKLNGSEIPYDLRYFISFNDIVFLGMTNNGNKAILRSTLRTEGNASITLNNIIHAPYPDGTTLGIDLYRGGVLRAQNVDFVPRMGTISSIGTGRAICLNEAASLNIAGTCSFTGFQIAIDFWGGSLSTIGTIRARYCDAVYRFYQVQHIADGAISSVNLRDSSSESYTVNAMFRQPDDSKANPRIIERIPDSISTLSEANIWAKNVLARCMNNPYLVVFRTGGFANMPYGDYALNFISQTLVRVNNNYQDAPESHQNMLLGTSYFAVVNDNNYSCANVREWRKVGGNAIPTLVDVSIPQYPKVKKGMLFSSYGQTVCKDYYNYCGSSYQTVSLLIKGTGTFQVYFDIMGIGTDPYSRMLEVNSPDKWIPVTYTICMGDAADNTRDHGIKFKMQSSGSITVAAIKVEGAPSASSWSPHTSEFPTGGPTSDRPVGVDTGYQYFDTDENKTIVWNGSLATPAWVNIDGSPLT